jgi:hypothetical protein
MIHYRSYCQGSRLGRRRRRKRGRSVPQPSVEAKPKPDRPRKQRAEAEEPWAVEPSGQAEAEGGKKGKGAEEVTAGSPGFTEAG